MENRHVITQREKYTPLINNNTMHYKLHTSVLEDS